jgi:hypothetical protein
MTEPIAPRSTGSKRHRPRQNEGTHLHTAIIVAPLLLTALVGLFSGSARNVLPAPFIVDGAFIAAALVGLKRAQSRVVFVIGVTTGFVMLNTIIWIFRGAISPYDFLQAYQAFIYVALLGGFVGIELFNGAQIRRLTIGLLCIFIVKYGYSLAFGLDHRPGVFTENNFELILIIGLAYLASATSKHPGVMFAGLVLVVMMSGSRSAMGALMVAYAFRFMKLGSRELFLHVTGLAVLVIIVSRSLAARMENRTLREIDRLEFFRVFRYESQDWSVTNWLFGTMPLTELSAGSCVQLAYYSQQFGFAGEGSCYATILHSYLLRAVFDYGLVGLALVYSAVWLLLRWSGVTIKDRIAILGIVTASAFSVSAFNSSFVAILLAICASHAPPLAETLSRAASSCPELASSRFEGGYPNSRFERYSVHVPALEIWQKHRPA